MLWTNLVGDLGGSGSSEHPHICGQTQVPEARGKVVWCNVLWCATGYRWHDWQVVSIMIWFLGGRVDTNSLHVDTTTAKNTHNWESWIKLTHQLSPLHEKSWKIKVYTVPKTIQRTLVEWRFRSRWTILIAILHPSLLVALSLSLSPSVLLACKSLRNMLMSQSLKTHSV